jgi:hypothetical protein
MSHNLVENIIPGAIALAIIVGGILWCLVDDIRLRSGRPPLRLHLRVSRSQPAPRVQMVPRHRASADR